MDDIKIKTEDFCEGKLLVATPSLHGSCFEKSVIYMCSHNADGAMGVIINHIISEISFSSVLEQFKLNNLSSKDNEKMCQIYFGGPVETQQGFILHTNDYITSESLVFNKNFSLSSNAQLLSDVCQDIGPSNLIFCFGYSGWSSGQLEEEIRQGSWYTVDASKEIIFNKNNDQKWVMAANTAGIKDPFYISKEVGHA